VARAGRRSHFVRILLGPGRLGLEIVRLEDEQKLREWLTRKRAEEEV
jgi:hypothetical protein